MNDNQIKNVTVKGNRILVIEASRNENSELEIKLTSPINFSFLRSRGVNEEKKITIAGRKCFYPHSQQIKGICGSFYPSNDYAFHYKELPNLMILLAENINDGAVFNFGDFPVSEDDLDLWIKNLNQDIKALYFSFLRPISRRVEITTSIIEREISD